MQVEIVAEVLGELSNTMIEGRWNDVRDLINPQNGVDIYRIRSSVQDVVKVAKLNVESLNHNKFISNEVRNAAMVEIQMRVAQILTFVGTVVHEKYPGDNEYDVFLFTLFDSRHEWLALAAISSAYPCASVDYGRVKETMKNVTEKVKYAYNDFILRVAKCQRATPSAVPSAYSSYQRSVRV